MTVDRQKVLDAFAAYIRPYDAQDPKVSLKIHHTYRVAALCEQIGRSIALEGTALDLAWLCGMLHDVGRFEQLRRFGTFDDSKSIDHARAGVQVLFEQGHIRDYLDDDSEDAMLRTAVEWHSAYRLPDGLDERTVMYCNILRDADKIDILRVNVETPLEDIYNVTTAELLASPVTPAVQQAFYEHHAVLRSIKQHPADHAVERFLTNIRRAHHLWSMSKVPILLVHNVVSCRWSSRLRLINRAYGLPRKPRL